MSALGRLVTITAITLFGCRSEPAKAPPADTPPKKAGVVAEKQPSQPPPPEAAVTPALVAYLKALK